MYTYLIVDVVNLAYRIKPQTSKQIIKTAKGYIYKELAQKIINTITELVQYHFCKEVVLLFDNYMSKIELKKQFIKGLNRITSKKEIKSTYKAHRQQETHEFYLTLDFIRYYYLINKENYHTVQIKKLEADDLVGPCISCFVKDETALLVTNDMDWAIHLNERIHYTPKSFYAPVTPQIFFEMHGFYPSKNKITLYKVLFGDHSDNIEVTYPEIPFSMRKKIFETVNHVNELYFLDIEKYPFLAPWASYIKSQEQILKMNEYMLLPIPLDEALFTSHYTTGRNSARLRALIENSLKTTVKEKEVSSYVFGGGNLTSKKSKD